MNGMATTIANRMTPTVMARYGEGSALPRPRLRMIPCPSHIAGKIWPGYRVARYSRTATIESGIPTTVNATSRAATGTTTSRMNPVSRLIPKCRLTRSTTRDTPRGATARATNPMASSHSASITRPANRKAKGR